MGVKNGLPAQEHLLVIPLVELKNAYFQKRPGPLWGSDVINPRSWTGCWHVVGMEFGSGLKLNVRITKRPASNNAELVKIAADMCAKHNARPASPAEAGCFLEWRSNPVRLHCDCHYEIASPHSWNSNAKALCAPTSGQEERRFAARHGIGAVAGQCKFATPAVSRIARHVIGLWPHRELVELGAEQCERRQRQDRRR